MQKINGATSALLTVPFYHTISKKTGRKIKRVFTEVSPVVKAIMRAAPVKCGNAIGMGMPMRSNEIFGLAIFPLGELMAFFGVVNAVKDLKSSINETTSKGVAAKICRLVSEINFLGAMTVSGVGKICSFISQAMSAVPVLGVFNAIFSMASSSIGIVADTLSLFELHSQRKGARSKLEQREAWKDVATLARTLNAPPQFSKQSNFTEEIQKLSSTFVKKYILKIETFHQSIIRLEEENKRLENTNQEENIRDQELAKEKISHNLALIEKLQAKSVHLSFRVEAANACRYQDLIDLKLGRIKKKNKTVENLINLIDWKNLDKKSGNKEKIAFHQMDLLAELRMKEIEGKGSRKIRKEIKSLERSIRNLSQNTDSSIKKVSNERKKILKTYDKQEKKLGRQLISSAKISAELRTSSKKVTSYFEFRVAETRVQKKNIDREMIKTGVSLSVNSILLVTSIVSIILLGVVTFGGAVPFAILLTPAIIGGCAALSRVIGNLLLLPKKAPSWQFEEVH